MFEFMKNIIDDIIDDFWPDFEEEILYQIDLKLMVPYVPESPGEKHVHWLCLPFCCFRNWYVYSTDPCKI